MRPLSALLHRLRRFGAPPGRPAETISVPVSLVEDAAVELAPVFAVLDRLADEAEERREHGRREAAAILATARAEAAGIQEHGQRAAEEARATILGAAESATAAEAASMLATARREADAVQARAAAGTPAVVALLVGEIEQAAR